MDDATKAKGNRPKFATNVPKDGGIKAKINTLKPDYTDISEPQTLTPAKLSIHATPIQFKNWEYNFLAYFEGINGNIVNIDQQQSILKDCIAEDFYENLRLENLPVTNPICDGMPFDNPNGSCLQRLNEYILQKVPKIEEKYYAMKGIVNEDVPILDQFIEFAEEYQKTQTTMSSKQRLILAFLLQLPEKSNLSQKIMKKIHTYTSKIGRAHV